MRGPGGGFATRPSSRPPQASAAVSAVLRRVAAAAVPRALLQGPAEPGRGRSATTSWWPTATHLAAVRGSNRRSPWPCWITRAGRGRWKKVARTYASRRPSGRAPGRMCVSASVCMFGGGRTSPRRPVPSRLPVAVSGTAASPSPRSDPRSRSAPVTAAASGRREHRSGQPHVFLRSVPATLRRTEPRRGLVIDTAARREVLAAILVPRARPCESGAVDQTGKTQ